MATKATRPAPQKQDDTAVAQPKRPKYDGQLEASDIALILRARRANAAAARAEFLKSHPHYTACSVAGCEGLVGPAYQAVTPDGRKYGFCPRRQVHVRLMPALFVGKAA